MLCSVCHNEVELVKGGNNRPACRCPVCGSLERHRALVKYLAARNLQGKVVLDFCPPPGMINWYAGRGCHTILADIDKPDMQWIDITAIPYPDDCFDLVVCFHVLEHVIDDAKALSELYRVAKDEVLIHVPLNDGTTQEIVAADQPDHVRIYGLDLSNRLENVGFRFHLNPDKIWVCHKKGVQP